MDAELLRDVEELQPSDQIEMYDEAKDEPYTVTAAELVEMWFGNPSRIEEYSG